MVRESEDWVTRGKTIRQLIQELQTFENLDLEVRISLDEGETHKPISMLGKEVDNDKNIVCVLEYCGE